MRATLIHGRPLELDLPELRRRIASADPPPETVYGDEGTHSDGAVLIPAAVLVPIVARDAEFTMLFTRRAAHLRDHSGQVSFPGGRVAAGDSTAEATALREAREEIGLDAQRVELLGRLPEYRTRTGFRITPVIGLLTPPFKLRPDANEVDEIFEVPLDFLLDPANHQRQSRQWRGELRWFYAITYRKHTIWGATAGMLVNLYRQLTG